MSQFRPTVDFRLALFLGIGVIGIWGCAGPQIVEMKDKNSDAAKAPGPGGDSPGLRIDATRSTEANAEYHFSMAQAYSAEGNPDRAIEEYKLTLMFDPDSALVYARLATEYVKKGMLSAAVETCREALRRDPKFIDARLMLAGLFSTTREPNLALAEYDRVLKDDPKNEEAMIYISQILVDEGKPKEAVSSLRVFLKRNSESALTWYYLGRAEQRAERFNDAAKSFQKAMDIRPGFTQAGLALGYLYEERQMNSQAVRVYLDLYEQSQDLSAANRLATIFLREEKYKEAVRYLEAIEAYDPEDMNVRVKLGLVQMELKNYEKAVATFKTILTKNPESDRIHYYLGSLYEEMSRPDEAISELKQIGPASRLFSEAALHVAFLLKQAGKLSEAKAFILDAIQKSPRTPTFYLFQASLEEEAKNLALAVDILESAVKQFPDDEKLRYYLGSLHDRRGEIERSLDQMEQILKINPDNVDALNYIGYTWTVRGMRLADAEKLIRRAMSLRPNNGYIQDSWGWYLFTRGRVSEATVELEKAVRLKPTEATILEHLGDAYLKSNLREKALQRYREAAKHAEDVETRKKIDGKARNLRQDLVRSGRIRDVVEPGGSIANEPGGSLASEPAGVQGTEPVRAPAGEPSPDASVTQPSH